MSRYDLTQDELTTLLSDQPGYRARQLFDGLYRRLATPDELTDLPKNLREHLAGLVELAPALVETRSVQADGGETRKWLFTLADGALIETVLMHHPRHSTVCVSSQAGCAMGCTFCATGHGGFSRHLRAGEILEQVVIAGRAARERGRRLDHVVFMGMGEPLANYNAVLSSAKRINQDIGLAARHLTISTVGVVPGIERLTDEPLQVNLAVSLHGANDELRNQLVPLNKRYPLEVLIAACEHYVEVTGRRLSLEWALMAEVNDRPIDSIELGAIAKRLGAHVNLIPLNPTVGGSALGLRGSSPRHVRTFRDELMTMGVNVTVRRTRGREIDAACGQLAGSAALVDPTTNEDIETVRPTPA